MAEKTVTGFPALFLIKIYNKLRPQRRMSVPSVQWFINKNCSATLIYFGIVRGRPHFSSPGWSAGNAKSAFEQKVLLECTKKIPGIPWSVMAIIEYAPHFSNQHLRGIHLTKVTFRWSNVAEVP